MQTYGWALLGLLAVVAAPGCGSSDKDEPNASPGGTSGTASDDDDDADAGQGHSTGGAKHGQGGAPTQEAGTSSAVPGAGARSRGGDAGQGNAGKQDVPAGGADSVPVGGSAGEPEGAAGAVVTGGGAAGAHSGNGEEGGGLAAAGQSSAAGAPGKPACHSNADCANGEACAEYGSDGLFHCKEAASSGDALGEGCTSNDECEDQLCLDFSERCTRLCREDSDCGENDGFICVQLSEDGFCQKECASDAGCEEPQHCVLVTRFETQDWAWVCANASGGRPIGDEPSGGDCSGAADCASGLCLTYGTEDDPSYACTGPCENADDCPLESDLPVCGEVTMDLPAGGTQLVAACTPQ